MKYLVQTSLKYLRNCQRLYRMHISIMSGHYRGDVRDSIKIKTGLNDETQYVVACLGLQGSLNVTVIGEKCFNFKQKTKTGLRYVPSTTCRGVSTFFVDMNRLELREQVSRTADFRTLSMGDY